MGAVAKRPAWVLAAVGGLLVCYSTLLLDTAGVDFFVEEDGFFQTAGALAFLFGSGCFAFALTRSRGDSWVRRLALVALALAFLFAGGEELSWGQRLLGVDTPDAVSEVNAQDEINIHNLEGLDGWLDFDRLFQVFWVAFGVIVPIACALWERARGALDRLIPLLPLWVAVLLVSNQVISEIAYRAIGEADAFNGPQSLGHSQVEITESCVAVILGAGALAVALESRRRSAEAHAVEARAARGEAG